MSCSALKPTKRLANKGATELPMAVPHICAYVVPSNAKQLYSSIKARHLRRYLWKKFSSFALFKKCLSANRLFALGIQVYRGDMSIPENFQPSSNVVNALSLLGKSFLALTPSRQVYAYKQPHGSGYSSCIDPR